jgi:protein-disulfide isomerase
MVRRHVWLLILVAAALLVAACGPEMITPTAPTEAAVRVESTEDQEATTADPEPAAEVPVDEDDWRVLGSADAPVTIVEYSDFQ